MASSRISKSGNKVILKLNFDEASALEALLCRVDSCTDIGAATFDVWHELNGVREQVMESNEPDNWPIDYDAIRENSGSLALEE